MADVWNLFDERGCWTPLFYRLLDVGKWKLWSASFLDCKGGACIGKRKMG